MALPRSVPTLVWSTSKAATGTQVAHVVATQLHVHQARHHVVGVGVAVVGDALDERAGAVADAGDGEADGLGHGHVSFGVGEAGFVRPPVPVPDRRWRGRRVRTR